MYLAIKSTFVVAVSLLLLAVTRTSPPHASTPASAGLASEPGQAVSHDAPATDSSQESEFGRVYVWIPQVGLHDYAVGATDIVEARVIGQRAEFPPHLVPFTRVTLQVLSSVKGQFTTEIEARVAGAERPGRRVEVPAAPRFEVGDEVVLFLETEPTSQITGIMGLGQGTYFIRRGTEGQRLVSGLHATNEPVEEFLTRVGNELVK